MVLYVLLRAVLKALGLRLPSPYKTAGGRARSGVFGADTKLVMVDQTCPTDRMVTESRPDLLVQLETEKRLVIQEVACAWQPLIESRELEKRSKYQDLGADLDRQNPGFAVRVVPVVFGDLGMVGQLRQHFRGSQLFGDGETNGLTQAIQREVRCSSVKILQRHFTL